VECYGSTCLDNRDIVEWEKGLTTIRCVRRLVEDIGDLEQPPLSSDPSERKFEGLVTL
jgi:hypothetical protein